MSVFNSDSTPLSKEAVARLMKDKKELDEEPLIGTGADFVNDNIRNWHCNIVPLSGPYKDIPIHFALEFPHDYPIKPPHAYFITKIQYYGGAQVLDSKNRQIICLDLFGNFGKVHSEWGKDGQASGWSPSYSVKLILVNMQGVLLGDNYLSNNAKDIDETKKSAQKLVCGECPHRYDSIYPPITVKETTKKVFKLSDNVKCYSSRIGFDEDVLGYGIVINPKYASTPAEYLSFGAYKSGVRNSTMNQIFNEWLPVFINEEHWKRSEKIFLDRIRDMCKAPGVDSLESKILYVMSNIMNSMVVEVMKQDKNLSASDRFIDAFFNCYRILYFLKDRYPKLVQQADEDIKNFSSGKTTKTDTPNLGTWLINLLISDKYSWKDVSELFIKEVDTRNVFWYAVGNRYNPPKYPDLVNESSKNRATKVFDATQTSRALVCFQKKFIELASDIDIQELDDRFGIVSDDIKKTIKDIHKKVSGMKNWKDYFEWNELKYVSDNFREKQLIDALKASAALGYHKSSNTDGASKYNSTSKYNRYNKRY